LSKASKELINKLKTGALPVDFNWNVELYHNSPIPQLIPPEPTPQQAQRVKIVSECLRDGLHGVEQYPSVKEMLKYVDVSSGLGIDTMTIGIYPGKENKKIDTAIKKLLKEMGNRYPKIAPIVLSLATEESLEWMAECKQINRKLQAIIFMGTAPSRLLVEEWSQDFVLEKLGWAVKEAVDKYGVDVIGATEHTTQTSPDFLRKIIEVQVKNGAKYFCIADTIGIARPRGTFRIVRFVKEVLRELGKEKVMVDWHGHRDMGNDVANTLVAIAAGADRVHVVARGIGERAGNTQMEAVLINLTAILGEAGLKNPWQMEKLLELLSIYSDLVEIKSPSHGPLAGRSHTTSLGIHTAAMLKAEKLALRAHQLGEKLLADKLKLMNRRIYTAVDPQSVGGKHCISVGPWSGKSTVRLAHLALGGKPRQLSDETIAHVLLTAKKFGRELGKKELQKLLFNND